MSRLNLAWLLAMTFLTLVGLSVAYNLPLRATGNLRAKHDNVKLLIDIMDEVQQKYVRELDDKKMREFVENMIEGGLEHLDPHSGFINQEEFEQFNRHSKGKFGGIGVKITMDPRTKQVLVETPVVGTPAYKAGILAGDLIVKINGKATDNMSIKDVVQMIQGDPGEKVSLTVVHEGESEPVTIDITRAIINIDSVMGDLPLPDESKWTYMIDEKNKVAYIRITSFTETTMDELTKVVQKLQLQGMKGLILDLRNNPGGLLREAVEVSSLFLPEGETVVTTKGRNHQQEVYHSRAPKNMKPVLDVPICILLNRFSASASEIVAAALQDHLQGRAVVVGERSYGKGSVQNVIRMEGGATALKLTTASYWRPSGKNIHRFPDSKETDEWGVKPNKGFEVKLTPKERLGYFKYRRDRDILRTKNGKQSTTQKNEEEFKDRALEKALDHLRDQIKKGKNAAVPIPASYEARRTVPSAVRPGLLSAAVARLATPPAAVRREVAMA
jgi:carboxyl-terminal processing protease